MNDVVSPAVMLTIATASAFLGVAVYQRARDRVWNQAFAVHALAESAWVLCTYLIQIQPASRPDQAEFFIRLAHPTCALAVATLIDLAWVFPDRTTYAPWPWRVTAYGTLMAFSLVALSPQLITSLTCSHGTWATDFGWPFRVWGGGIGLALLYADVVMVRKLPRLPGLERAQTKYVLTGFVIGQAIGLVTMVILPNIWHTTYYSRWGSPGYIFVIAFTAYAIAKHRIVRPVVAVLHAASYLCTGLLVIGIGVGVAAALHWLIGGPAGSSATASVAPRLSLLVVGVLVGVTGPVVHGWVRVVLERRLLGGDPAGGASGLSDAILRTLDMEELPEFLAGTVGSILRPTFVAVYWQDRKTGLLTRRAAPEGSQQDRRAVLPQELSPDDVLPKLAASERRLIERSQVRRFYSMERALPILVAMRELDAELVAPVLWEGNLVGLVLVGEKLSGDMYGPEELALLQNMLPQVSLAVRNAQLYDEVVQMKEYSENILREMKSGVIAVSSEQHIVVVNPAAEDILGLKALWMVGRGLQVLPPAIVRSLQQVLSGVPVRSEDQFQITKPNGQKVPVACSCSVWRGTAQAPEGAVAVLSDLTLVEELARERQEAEHLALIRVLSAGMAHELRNPLVAIRTFSELLPRRWDDEEFRDTFQSMAKEEIDRIDRLLTDLLMLSKPADAVVEPVDVNEVCAGVVRTMSALADGRQVSLQVNLAAQKTRPLGDQSRLHQALINLVKNALEAESPGGRVEVATSVLGGYGNPTRVLITVFNPSSFIEEDQLGLIFKPFYTKRHQGTGLGLAICQTIIEEHNGSIAVTSRAGQGTEFAIELPVTTANREQVHGRTAGC
jgi:PAS domain S-box-containing protein